MRTGVVLPSFRNSPDEALAVAEEAERQGIDAVFAYDHLWPMGQPERPAIAPFPLLAAIATRTERLAVGTLVARVGLVPDRVLVSQFDALAVLAPDRVVAGLGTGDHLSAAENLAYGLPFSPAAERRAAVGACGRALVARGIPVWVGGGAPATVAVAEVEGFAINLWNATPAVVAVESLRSEVTWGGTVPEEGPEELLSALDAAGASWAVFAWPVDLHRLAGAARDLGSASPGA